MKLIANGFLGVAAVAALALIGVSSANATVEIKLINGLTTVDVKDGDANDACAAAGCVTYSGAVGNWTLNVSTGSTDAVNPPFLDLSSLNKSGSSPGALTILTSDNGYTPQQLGFQLDVGGTQNTPGSVAFSAYGGTSNTMFDTTTQIGSTLTFNTGAYSGSTQGYSASNTSPYSLTLEAVLNYTGTGKESVSFDAALNPIPEPAAIVLLGTAVLSIISLRRRQSRRA